MHRLPSVPDALCPPHKGSLSRLTPIGLSGRFELSPWMREACLVVRAHLGHGRGAPKSKELVSSHRSQPLGLGEAEELAKRGSGLPVWQKPHCARWDTTSFHK